MGQHHARAPRPWFRSIFRLHELGILQRRRQSNAAERHSRADQICWRRPPRRRFLPFTDTDAYRNIKVATEAFVMANCGVFSDFDLGDADYVQGQISLPKQIRPAALSQLLHQGLPAVRERAGCAGGFAAVSRHHPAKTGRSAHQGSRYRRCRAGHEPRRSGRMLRSIAPKADLPLPARTDLVVLAGGRNAGADHERAGTAVPEHAGATWRTIRWPIWKSIRCGR